MTALSYGLNITKKPPSSATCPQPANRKPIFDEESGSEDGSDQREEDEVETIGGLVSSSKSSRPPEKCSILTTSKKLPQNSRYSDLSIKFNTAKHASNAESLGTDIYDYDSVYESLHSSSKKNSAAEDKRPRYMSNLLAAAQVRKRDQLRAKEKMLAKEREAEGEEFAEKEKFVTGAYKAQQEEMKRMEKEEAKREVEETERRKKGGGGMVDMYKKLLDKGEKKHEHIVKTTEKELKSKAGNGASAKGLGTEEEVNEKSESDLAREKGATVNDDGQVVDKRQLLNAGLNIARKPKLTTSKSTNFFRLASKDNISASSQGGLGSKQAMRERQTRMLQVQLEEASKRAAQLDEAECEALERAAKSRKTTGDISKAKERYLKRKQEAAAATEAEKRS